MLGLPPLSKLSCLYQHPDMEHLRLFFCCGEARVDARDRDAQELFASVLLSLACLARGTFCAQHCTWKVVGLGRPEKYVFCVRAWLDAAYLATAGPTASP